MLLALSKLALVGFAAAVHAARADLAREGGRLWGVRLDTLEWMGVDGQRIYCTRRPDTTGFAMTADSLWVGPLPSGVAPANTSINRWGRRWAMVVLPLPTDVQAASRLLIHEAMHVIQPSVLPFPVENATGSGNDYLDGPTGRVWLRMEIAALADALSGATDAIPAALVFRARRLEGASPDERHRQLALELSEGLPEYTGWRLTDSAGFVTVLRTPEAPHQSYVRRFPYLTGPAYAFLLDRVRPDWHQGLTDSTDLGALLLEATVGRRYDEAEIVAAEGARWKTRKAQLDSLTAVYVTGPTVRIRPKVMNLSFDPRGQVPLGGGNGNVMANVTWKANDGAELIAPNGSLVSADWSELRVPLEGQTFAPGRLAATKKWQGSGWSLTLPAGWVVRADGTSWVITPAS
ncbi:MAG TPA: hypothetical protein VFA43_11225 [Gemmatimonadaceae bacterium]|nr:hypothetical protein [Gemmatimonadaceae bacterium]